MKNVINLRFSNKQILTVLAIFVLLSASCSFTTAEGGLPEPVVQFSFDEDDARLQVESGKIELLDDGSGGKALKVGEPEINILADTIFRSGLVKRHGFFLVQAP